MSTEREQIEKQVAEELGFTLEGGYVAYDNGNHYAANPNEVKLYEALRDSRLKLAEVETLLKKIQDTVALVPSVTGLSPARTFEDIPLAIRDLQQCYGDAARARNGDAGAVARLYDKRVAAADRLAQALEHQRPFKTVHTAHNSRDYCDGFLAAFVMWEEWAKNLLSTYKGGAALADYTKTKGE